MGKGFNEVLVKRLSFIYPGFLLPTLLQFPRLGNGGAAAPSLCEHFPVEKIAAQGFHFSGSLMTFAVRQRRKKAPSNTGHRLMTLTGRTRTSVLLPHVHGHPTRLPGAGAGGTTLFRGSISY